MGDSYTWMLPLDTTGVTPANNLDFVLELSRFGPRDFSTPLTWRYTLLFSGIMFWPEASPVLRYSYVCMPDDPWAKYLKNRLIPLEGNEWAR